jgi:hypothetical protein
MFVPKTPITDHPQLPDEVPLIASFHDNRNKLSHYYPRLTPLTEINTPTTKFFKISGNAETTLSVKYREITKFLQDIHTDLGFIRGDFSSAKLSQDGRILNSHDPYDIKETFATVVENHILTERHLGKQIAVREYIPHEVEVRYFIENGDILYRQEIPDIEQYPSKQAYTVASEFDEFSWSVDFIKHDETNTWYCIDMGLNGLYPEQSNHWIAISEHTDKNHSPQRHADKMPDADRFSYIR